MPGETLPSGSTNTQGIADWAAPYITNYLGKAQALSETPYQAYQGPLTAGTSPLQDKAFQGIANLAFPTNFGQSFSSTGAYQPPQLNMGAYQQKPIGIGNYNRPSFEQYTAGLPPGQQAPVNKSVYDAGLAGNQIYNQQPAPAGRAPSGISNDAYENDPAYWDRVIAGVKNDGMVPADAIAMRAPDGIAREDNAYMLSDMRYRPPGETADYIDRNNLSPYQAMARELQGQPSQNTPDNLPGLNNLFNQNMQAMTGLKNQGPAQRQTYEDYISSPTQELKMPREQFEAQQDMMEKMRGQGMDMLRRGDMNEIMAGLGGQPGQMPQGGLAGLMGRMQPPGLDQNAINANPRGFAEFQKGAAEQERQRPGSTMFSQQQAPGIAAQYMNPYLQSVLTPQLEELRRQNDITNMVSNAKLTGAGAYGGGRQAIMNAENNRNLMQEMNKTVGQGYASAYDKAMGQFNTEQGQAKDLVNLIGNAGAQQRGITSEGIAADKAEFEAQRQFPFQQAQFQRDMISGLPTGSVTNTPANLTGMGSFLSALGGGTAAASALGYKNVGELLSSLGLNLGQKEPE